MGVVPKVTVSKMSESLEGFGDGLGGGHGGFLGFCWWLPISESEDLLRAMKALQGALVSCSAAGNP